METRQGLQRKQLSRGVTRNSRGWDVPSKQLRLVCFLRFTYLLERERRRERAQEQAGVVEAAREHLKHTPRQTGACSLRGAELPAPKSRPEPKSRVGRRTD